MNAWEKYVPQGFAVSYINQILSPYYVEIRITKPRKTKLGDYRAPRYKSYHKISVNNNLNPYSFLITLIHEIAHLIVFEQHKGKVQSHGMEWKKMYFELLLPCIDEDVFPIEIANCLKTNDIKAGANSDIELSRLLKQYDTKDSELILVEELQEFSKFKYKGRVFQLQHKLRKRYKCLEMSTNKLYLFSPVAEVKLVEN